MNRSFFSWRWIATGAIFLGLIAVVAFKREWFALQSYVADVEAVPIVVGMCAEYKPYEFSNEQGEIIGFDVDIAREIARRLNRPLVIKNMEFGAIILALKLGGIDFVISAMAITPERLETVEMIPYYGSAMRDLALIFSGEVPERVEGIEDLQAYEESKGRQAIIAVQTGTAQADYADKLEKLHIRRFDSPMETVMDMQQGKADAMLSAYELASLLLRERPGEFVLLNVPLPQEDWVAGYGIALRKGDELYEKIKPMIARMKKEGFIAKAEQLWFEEGNKKP